MIGCRPLTDEEIQKIIDKLSRARSRYAKRNVLLFLFGLKTGFRITELLSIKVQDVLTKEGKVSDHIHVKRNHVKAKTFGRSCVLHPDIKRRIKPVIDSMELKPDDYLFCSQRTRDKMRRESVHRMFKKSYDLLGLTGMLGTHCMRKTFAKNVYRRTGYDILATRDALGHSDVWNTVKYLQADRDKINQAILSND